MKNTRNVRGSSIFVTILLLFLVKVQAQQRIPHHFQSYTGSFGINEGKKLSIEEKRNLKQLLNDKREYRQITQRVQVPNAAWLQLFFDNPQLGKHSYVEITSVEDGSSQHLNTKKMKQWGQKSAVFNGDVLEVTLYVAPDDKGITLNINRLLVGEFVRNKLKKDQKDQKVKLSSQCGIQDNRVGSNDPAVGRILPIGCTGWIISNGGFLTAGHCAVDNNSINILEFNVPASDPDGTINVAGADDQYPVIDSSISFEDADGDGNNWAIFNCGPNANTDLLAAEAQRAFYRVSKDFLPTTMRITGYGADRGNSGSPVIWEGAAVPTAIGIHTNAGCTTNSNSGGNNGSSFEADDLEKVIQDFGGTNVEYVDGNHLVAANLTNGTIMRPFRTVSEAISSVNDDAIISIAEGNYRETLYITQTLTIRAPVGGVTIGPEVESNTRMQSDIETMTLAENEDPEQEIQEINELSLEEFTEKDWVMYPNPADNTLSFRLQQGATYTVNIYNSGGYEVSGLDYFTDQFGGIDISSFAAGTYLVKVFNHETGEVKTEKLIIE
ncbi:MAG: T9SS type A sorting domain-containing protein [Bacteroidota bacterium]